MGLVSDAAINAASKQAEMKRALKGRTPEQQSVIKYFYGAGGCFSKGLTDDQYEKMVMDRAKSLNLKIRAIDRIGIDESELQEIAPVTFEGYVFSNKGDNYAKRGTDGVWRSSAYQVTWIFFGDDQVHLYQYTFNMDENGKKESTESYFYQDVTNFSTQSDTVEKVVVDKVSCTGKTTYVRTSVDFNKFKLVVPGDSLFCSMRQNDYTDRAIRAMKAKLVEKKRR